MRFAPLSAAGPSGQRPEHLQDMLACSRKACTMRFLRVLATLIQKGEAAELPQCLDWLRDSRLVFLAKKKSAKPRPVRIRELWRRVIAKRVLALSHALVQQRLLERRQFGVAIPGGVEALAPGEGNLQLRPKRCMGRH